MEIRSSGVSKIINIARVFLEAVCGVLLIFFTVVVFAQVVNRFIFKGSFAWAEEAAIYTMIWMVFLGTSINVLKGTNVKIDFFVALLPVKIQKFLDIVCQMICFAFTGLMCTKSWKIIKLNANNLAPGIKIPISVMYLGLTASAVLMMIFFCYRIVCDMKEMTGKDGEGR